MPEPQDLTARFQLKQLLNWTASARTFSGSHPTSGEPVAVKLLSLSRAPAADELGRRFENMARVLQSLGHPALPRIVEFGLTPTGDAFLVTRWIEGTPLPADQTVPPARLLPMILRAVEALETVSLHGVFHLNLTPDNLLVQADGVARIVGWGTSLLTVDWQASGTERVESGPTSPWSAPELTQPLFPGGAPWRADLYSIALICVRALGARIENRTDAEPAVRFDKELSSRVNQPEKLRQVLERCLRRTPKERPDTYGVLAQALQHAMPRGESPKETLPVERVEARPRPRPEDATVIAAIPGASPPAPAEEATDRPRGKDRDRTVVLPAASAGVTGTRPGPPPEPPAGPPSSPPPDQDGDETEAATVVGMRRPDLSPPGEKPAEAASAPSAAPPPERPEGPPVEPPKGPPEKPPEEPPKQPPPKEPPQGPPPKQPPSEPPPPSAPPPGPVASPSSAAPAAQPQRPPPTAPAARPASPATREGGGGLPKVWIAVGAGALVILAVIVIALVAWLGRDRSAEAPEPDPFERPQLEEAAAVELPEEAPPVPLPEQLEQALLQISEGNLLAARETLEQLSDLEEAGELPAEVGSAYYSVVEALRRARAEEVEGQLREALERYDLEGVNRTLRSMNGEEERQLERRSGGRELLERARNVRASVSVLETALREGQLLEALEGANRLRAENPALADSLDIRERAAAGIERSIDVLIEAGRLEEAQSRLTRLDELWPSRPGTAARRQAVEGGIRSQERYETLLASIADTGREGRPHEGLEMIAEVEVPAEYRARLDQLREALGAQLEQADRQPPQIQIVDPEVEFRRNRPVQLDFEVTDDYEVIDFTVRARRAGGEYQELALEELGGGRYRVELSPSFHDNRPIELWAEARDRLGNVKRLAGPDSPIELRRGRRR